MAEDTEQHVNPKHYSDLGEYAAIHVITKWDLGFELGNALKYIQRAGNKPGNSALQDLEKAEWYLRRKLHIMAPDKHPCPSGVRSNVSQPDRTPAAALSRESAAERLGVHPNTVGSWLARGILPSLSREDVEALYAKINSEAVAATDALCPRCGYVHDLRPNCAVPPREGWVGRR